jgi:hypothetical protein
MSKSIRLNLREIRLAFDTVYECCDLGADPVAWRKHLVRQLPKLLNCQVAMGGRACFHENDLDSVPKVFSDYGWGTESERRVYADWIHHGRAMDNPVSARVAETRVTRMIATRRQWVTDSIWYRAPLVQQLMDTGRIDDSVFSFEHLEPGRYLLLVGSRAKNDRRFNHREREMLALVHGEIRRHLGSRLATFDTPGVTDLPPRLRLVLRNFLEGDGEKQIAIRLGLSSHTVHEHAKRLYRHFRVASRAELLSRCGRFLPVLEAE